MDVTTANRFHLGEILFSSILRVPVIALLGLRLWELMTGLLITPFREVARTRPP
jgi:sterol desaturase/sphingolipid hydroxylase (fatty acid hydroxylase superfamily)